MYQRLLFYFKYDARKTKLTADVCSRKSQLNWPRIPSWREICLSIRHIHRIIVKFYVKFYLKMERSMPDSWHGAAVWHASTYKNLFSSFTSTCNSTCRFSFANRVTSLRILYLLGLLNRRWISSACNERAPYTKIPSTCVHPLFRGECNVVCRSTPTRSRKPPT